jgi:hypothetical protein
MYDNNTSTVKLCAVIHDCIDTEDMFVDFFDQLRRRKVIPAGAGLGLKEAKIK